MCIRGGEELIQAFQMDRNLEVNKWKRREGRGAAGEGFFCSSSPSPSTTSQVCLRRRALCTECTHLSLWLKDLLLKFRALLELTRTWRKRNFYWRKPAAFAYTLFLFHTNVLQLYTICFVLEALVCGVHQVDVAMCNLCHRNRGCHDDINALDCVCQGFLVCVCAFLLWWRAGCQQALTAI